MVSIGISHVFYIIAFEHVIGSNINNLIRYILGCKKKKRINEYSFK